MRRTTPLYRIGISFCPFAGIRSLLITQLSSAFVNKLYIYGRPTVVMNQIHICLYSYVYVSLVLVRRTIY